MTPQKAKPKDRKEADLLAAYYASLQGCEERRAEAMELYQLAAAEIRGLDLQIAELRKKLPKGYRPETDVAKAKRPADATRQLSAAARKKISDAQKKRWVRDRKYRSKKVESPTKRLSVMSKIAPDVD